MKIELKSKKERLDFFKSLYENAKSAYEDCREGFRRNMRQYKGSTEIDGSSERALTVRNITYEIVESQVNSQIPAPKADPPSYSESKARLAETIERLCRATRDRLPFGKLNDLDERYTYIFGGSVWYAEWNNESKIGNEIGTVEVHCLPPEDFIPEPCVFEVEDMEYCFLRFTTTRGALIRKYGISLEEASLAECESELGEDGLADTVSVTVCFYKDEYGHVSQFVFSGLTTLSDIEGYYKRKIKVCKKCSQREDLCSCEKPTFVVKNEDTELVSDPKGVYPDASVNYYLPRRFPIVIRKNTSTHASLFGQSDCDYIRPEQQAINKVESRILQKLLRSGVTPVVPEDSSVAVNNSIFGQVIKMKPGESMAQYGKVDTTPDISADIAEAERLYEHAKRVIGISDAYLGISQNRNESGYARQLQISQASGRLESKRQMKNTAYAELYRIIFEHYLAFADEPRMLAYKDGFGRIHNERFNRYDFLDYDAEAGEYFYDDAYLFSVDENGGAEYQREALWERNLENLKSGTLGDPTHPSTLLRYWQTQERAHYPFARENVEYFTELIRKEGDNPYGSETEKL